MVVSIFIVLVVIALIAIGFYNKLVKLSLKVEETYANIDVILKQRFDTLGNLLNTVKGYMNYEQEILTKIVTLRTTLAKPDLSEEEHFDAENQLSQELPKFMAIAEGYPELKSSENFIQLQQTIVLLEENLSASRRTYNAMVNEYNTFIKSFPAVLFAGSFGYHEKRLFKALKEERENVEISF